MNNSKPRVFTVRGGPFNLLATPEPHFGWFDDGQLIGIDVSFLKPSGRSMYPDAREGVDYVHQVQGLTLVYKPHETATHNANFG